MLLARSLAASALSLAFLFPAGTACSQTPDTGPGPVALSTAARGDAARETSTHVLTISIDGLNTKAITRLGQTGAPTLHRLLAEGAGTLNARTEVEQTVTLPNHTSMMTGRRVTASKGGHGVTWDDDRPGTTVEEAAGHPVASIFSAVHADGGSTALYSTKTKFGLYERSWPKAIDTFTVRENQRRLVRLAKADLTDGAPTFTFLHVSLPDRTGHEYGGMSSQYVDAVQRTDAQLSAVISAVAGTDVVVVLTSDHGFATGETDHSGKRDLENYRIPFLTWGHGVDHGDLYRMNPGFLNPGTGRPTYAGKQPVRNGDVANLAADLLGLAPVPGSGIDADQSLRVSRS